MKVPGACNLNRLVKITINANLSLTLNQETLHLKINLIWSLIYIAPFKHNFTVIYFFHISQITKA